MSKTPMRIVIVGGGTAGWMTASALSKFLNSDDYMITLVESEQIGSVGVGEATVPHIRYFNQTLGIDENDFIRRTNATYKLGIEFIDWKCKGESYIHPFGLYGREINGISFHHYWLKLHKLGETSTIGDYAIGVKAAEKNRFQYPDENPSSLASKYSYAFHIDASLYAEFLREYSEEKGVQRIEGKVADVTLSGATGAIESISLESGEVVEGDFFIDCSGFRALLIEQTLHSGFEDWSRWLPCDRAVAVPSEKSSTPLPYTKATAKDAGWQWRIPLQNRTGNGQVYCSKYLSDEAAADSLLNNLDGRPLADVNQLRFTTGRRKKTWEKNCVAIGLSSGFLEPLESTSIYLIQIAITKLIEYFPDKIIDSVVADEFNRDMAMEYDRIRDFLILHYTATDRTDTEFWRYMQTMEKPASLQRKIDLFRHQGHVEKYKKGMFLEPSWVAVYLGQGIVPQYYHPLVDELSVEDLKKELADVRMFIEKYSELMPAHADSLNKYLDNNSVTQVWPPGAMSLYGVFS